MIISQLNFSLCSQDPIYFKDAIKEEYQINAMNDEMESIEKSDTWEQVNFHRDKECIGVKWVYKTKYMENGEVDKYMERQVTKGFIE